jgi:4-amino-4-deoxy-L-arabinose transferase-like glycosyltransferase
MYSPFSLQTLSTSHLRHHALILLIAVASYFPFVNQAVNVDSDLFMHMAQQLSQHPINPPLGEYGRHLIQHEKTLMPQSSVYYRCSHPPLLPLLFSPVALLFGNTEWPYHAGMFAFYLLAIYGAWFFFGLWLTTKQSLYATLLWTVCPALVVNSHTLMWDMPITALMLWSFAFGVKANRTNSVRMTLYSGLIAGIAALVKSNCIPLFILMPFLFVQSGKRKLCVIWLTSALPFPLLWIIHNLIFFGKVQYFSTNLFHPIIGDIRYRLERSIGFLGGCIVLPVFWYWLIFATKQKLKIPVLCGIAVIVWGMLLVIMLHKSVVFGIAYTLFAWPGLWAFVRILDRKEYVASDNSDIKIVHIFVVLYIMLIISFPSASVRYMLPVIPMVILTIAILAQKLPAKSMHWFWATAIATTILLSGSVSIADYLLSDADRLLPKKLIARGYMPQHTWYFGRLGYDWYLYKSGYKNIRTEKDIPKAGDFLIEEILPLGYTAAQLLPKNLNVTPVETLTFFSYPVRTMGCGAGFYGSDRLAYGVAFGWPQKIYSVNRIGGK